MLCSRLKGKEEEDREEMRGDGRKKKGEERWGHVGVGGETMKHGCFKIFAESLSCPCQTQLTGFLSTCVK